MLRGQGVRGGRQGQRQRFGLGLTTSKRNLTSKGDIVIIGGGVTGSSTAFWLAKHCQELSLKKQIYLIEKDISLKYGATTRSAGSIRHQFSHPINIQISQFGTDFLRNITSYLSTPSFTPDVNFKEAGYLFLASEGGVPLLQNNHKTQKSLGVDVVLLSPQEMKSKFPHLSVGDIAMGSFGVTGEGWLDPYGLAVAFRKKAEQLGVKIVSDEVVRLELSKDKQSVLAVQLKDTAPLTISESGSVVNSAGLYARKLLNMVGDDIPVSPKKRCIFVVDCEEMDKLRYMPMVIDKTGVYFRPEGKYFIAGVAPPEDRDFDTPPDNFDVDYQLWDETIWPVMASRVPNFEAAKVVNAWAGHYDYNTFDQNTIVGPHPFVKNLYLANGFSGHGLQQSPAIGRALSEHILHGEYKTLDLSPFGLDRIKQNKPIQEINIV